MWPRPRLTSVHSGVFSPVVVTPVWAGPARAWTGHGPGRSLLSPLRPPRNIHTITHPRTQEKTQKYATHEKWEGKSQCSQSGGVEARRDIGPSVTEPSVTEADSSHSILRCPEPGQVSVSGPTHGAVIARVPGTGHRQSPAHVTHVTRSGLITDVTLVTTPALHPRVSTNSSLPVV